MHKNNPELATQKAKDLVRMAVNKVALMQPLSEADLDITQSAMVIGGGISGMTTALSLARQGYETHLVEKGGQLGGQARNIYKTITGDLIQEKLADMIDDVEKHDNIQVHLNTEREGCRGICRQFQIHPFQRGVRHPKSPAA